MTPLTVQFRHASWVPHVGVPCFMVCGQQSWRPSSPVLEWVFQGKLFCFAAAFGFTRAERAEQLAWGLCMRKHSQHSACQARAFSSRPLCIW